MKNELDELHEMKVTISVLNCLGIYLSHDEEECRNKNGQNF